MKPKRHWTLKTRQIGWALVFAFLIERAYPTPWLQGPFGKAAYLFVVFYVVKAFVEYRQERSARFYAKTQKYNAWIKGKRFNLSDYTRYRIASVWRIVIIGLAIGYIIDASSPSCEGAVNCAVSISTLIGQNMGDLVQFMIRLALGFVSFLGIQEIAARQGLMDVTLPHSIKTRFADVYGQDKAVASVKEVLEILNKPAQVEALGGFMPTGVMLFGPPGVGKSYLAEAAAGEAEMPFISIDGTSFTSMWAGVPQRRVKLIFKKLRQYAIKFGGCVVFFDEIDVLGSRGGGVLQQLVSKMYNRNVSDADAIQITSGGSGILQQMLTEMSGMKKSRGMYNKIRVWLGFEPLPPIEPRILHLAATNMEGALDPALLRPGRYDRKIRMDYPQLAGRIETIVGYLNKIHEHTLTDAEILIIARENPLATGASIKSMVNEGLLSAVRDGRDYVTFTDLRDYLLKVQMGEASGEMELPEDRWRTAVHEAAHAVMSHHVRPEAPIQFASVHKRGKMGGFVKAVNSVDRYTLKSRLVADMMVSLASTWAEKHYFAEDVSTGPSSDLFKASAIAEDMYLKYAMGNSVYVWDKERVPAEVWSEIEDWVNAIYVNTHEFLDAHRDEVELVAQLLQEQGTLDGSEIHELLRRFE